MIGSMIAGGGAAVLGIAAKVIGLQMAARHERDLALIGARDDKFKQIDKARQYNPPIAAAIRATIALVALMAVIVWPLVVPVFWPATPVTFSWVTVHASWFGFGGGKGLTWHTVHGLAITPVHTQLVAAVTGFYLGSR